MNHDERRMTADIFKNEKIDISSLWMILWGERETKLYA